MRITRETLMKFANDAVAAQAKTDRNLLAACLVGSVLADDPMISGSADIDLILIHSTPPAKFREIQRLTDDVSLDLYHYDQAIFFQPRHLRLDPWLGPTIQNHPQLLHDARHWFEFTQASVGSQFYRPDYCVARSRSLLARARQSWSQISLPAEDLANTLSIYLSAVENAANAIACLSGPPLTIRRFLTQFPVRVQQIGKPGLMNGLMGLLAPEDCTAEEISHWATDWQSAFDAAGSRTDLTDPELHPARKQYLLSCVQSLIEVGNPSAALWPLLNSWTGAIRCLPRTTVYHQPWLDALATLHLDGKNLVDRVHGLDAYLDTVDETLDQWALENGA
jgi:hypothetical protein